MCVSLRHEALLHLGSLFQQLSDRLTHMDCSTAQPATSPDPNLTMTHDRRPTPQGSGLRTPPSPDRYQLSRVDCPSFNGSNTIEWLRRCQSYFELHQEPDQLRTKIAIMQFHDRASEWYDGFLIDHDPPEWLELVKLVRKRFNRSSTKNEMEDLLELHQTGSTEEYIELFERLRSKLFFENHLFYEFDCLDVFVGDLKAELKAFVKVFKPQTLEDAFDYALHMDSALDSQLRKFISNNRVTPILHPLKPSPIPNSTKNTLMDQKCLCFKCEEKYFLIHQCKVKVQMSMGQDESIEGANTKVDHVPSSEDMEPEEAIVSLYASHSNPKQTIMRFKGKIGNKPVCALIDSGSTHSFVDPAVLNGQSIVIEDTHPLIVMVANGVRMVTYSKWGSIVFLTRT
jgi:Retrotransposon gag protein